MSCCICGCGKTGKIYILREMMFGTKEGFEYDRCPDCGSFEIANPPADLGRFYPSNYYSFNPQNKKISPKIKSRGPGRSSGILVG